MSGLFAEGRKKTDDHYLPSKPLTLDLIETQDLSFSRACYNQHVSNRKMERIKVVEKLEIYKFGSVHFWYIIHPKKLRNLQQKVHSFYAVQS
jgi:hypothetical protein